MDIIRDYSGSSNRLSTVEVKDNLFLAIFDDEIVIIPINLQDETVEILHESH